MALVLANRVQETATPNTTVSFTLTGAVSGFQTFAVIGNTNTTYYTATDTAGNWEVGLGQYSTTGPTLTRLTFYASSAGGGPVSFPGNVTVFVTYPSGSSVYLDFSGNVSPLGTIFSGNWQASTVGVAYGGTGVTTSSGPNSVVLRDANENITVNRINQGLQTVTATGGTTTLTAASDFNQALVGTGGHTFRLPDATTLSDTTTFQFNNNATGTLTIENNAGTAVGTVASGGAAGIALLSNATVGGTWDVHAYIPENVTWGTNALALGGTVISGGTWQGGTIQSGYGGTGLTTFTGANNALYSTSASALTAGTLPVAAGGTGATTLTGYVYGNGTGAMTASTSIPNSATTATSANTASTIVARDASGDFSAGTITASLSGNATSATTATTANALNTGNSYTGTTFTASSTDGYFYANRAAIANQAGIQFRTAGTTNWWNYLDNNTNTLAWYQSNTSTQVMTLTQAGTLNVVGNITLGGSQVLTAGNFNSYAPTLTGGGASGTWGINISGNAATATSATSATSATTATTATNQSGGTVNATTGAFSQNITVGNGTAVDPSNVTAFAAGTITEGSTGFSAQGIAFGGGSGQHGAIVYGSNTMYFGTENGSDNTMNTRATLSSAGAFNTTGAITQNGSQVLTAGNYNSYAPTLTGTGASGTWGISISGNAATATTATNVSGGTVSSTRINPRSLASPFGSGSLTINSDTTDVYTVSLGGAITFLTPSGTPVNGQRLMIRVKDSGSALGITWTTSSGAFRAVGVTLPTTTVAGKVTYIGCVYNSTDVFWDAVAVATQA